MWSQKGLQAGSPAFESNTEGWNPMGPGPSSPFMNTLVRPVAPAEGLSAKPGEGTMRIPSAMGSREVSATMYRTSGKHSCSLKVTRIPEVSGGSTSWPPPRYSTSSPSTGSSPEPHFTAAPLRTMSVRSTVRSPAPSASFSSDTEATSFGDPFHVPRLIRHAGVKSGRPGAEESTAGWVGAGPQGPPPVQAKHPRVEGGAGGGGWGLSSRVSLFSWGGAKGFRMI